MMGRNMSTCRTQWLLFLVVMLFSNDAFSVQQDQGNANDAASWEANAGVEFVTRYHWRGMLLSSGPAIQPSVELSAGGFTAGLWGSSTMQAFAWQETDIFLSYSWKSFTLSLVDYFYYNETVLETDFFDYRKNTTGHVIEAMAEFTGTDKMPFRILAGYNIYGADTSNSMYFELAWMKSLSEVDIEIFAGLTPHAGYYHETKRGFTNVGMSMQKNLYKNDRINMPLKVSAVYDPFTKRVFLVAGIGIF